MAMRDKQKKTSLPFHVMITELYRRAGVPFDTTRDVKVIRLSSTNIHHIDAEYMFKESDSRKQL